MINILPLVDYFQAYHKVSRQEFLEELSLFVLNSFNDEFIITGDVEERAAGPGVRQLDQWIVTQGILQEAEVCISTHSKWSRNCVMVQNMGLYKLCENSLEDTRIKYMHT